MSRKNDAAYTFAEGSQYDPKNPTARRRGTAERDPYTNRLTGREVNHLGLPMGSSHRGDGSTLGGVTPTTDSRTPSDSWAKKFPTLPNGQPRPAAPGDLPLPSPAVTGPRTPQVVAGAASIAARGGTAAPPQLPVPDPGAIVAAATQQAAQPARTLGAATRAPSPGALPLPVPLIRAPADGSRANFRTQYGPVAVSNGLPKPQLPTVAKPAAPTSALPSRAAALTGAGGSPRPPVVGATASALPSPVMGDLKAAEAALPLPGPKPPGAGPYTPPATPGVFGDNGLAHRAFAAMGLAKTPVVNPPDFPPAGQPGGRPGGTGTSSLPVPDPAYANDKAYLKAPFPSGTSAQANTPPLPVPDKLRLTAGNKQPMKKPLGAY